MNRRDARKRDMPITADDVPTSLLYEWFPLSRQDIADVLNDEEKMPDANRTEDHQDQETDQSCGATT